MLGVVESVCIKKKKKKLQSTQIGERNKLSIDIYSSVKRYSDERTVTFGWAKGEYRGSC